jgi:citrate synthase
MGELVTARVAAERLGVDVRTLYAYVSRGALTRVGLDERRRGLYDSDEVELLARRARPRTFRRSRAALDVTVGSAVSTIELGRLRYRGHEVGRLVQEGARFEDVAELLWTGGRGRGAAWTLPVEVRAAALRACAGLDERVSPLGRMAIGLAAAAPLLDGPVDEDGIARRLVTLLAELAGGDGGAGRTGADGSGADGSGMDGSGMDGSGMDGSGMDGSGMDGSGMDGSGMDGTGMDETGADETGADETGADGSGMDGTGADADGVDRAGVARAGSAAPGAEPFPLARRLWNRLSPLAPTAGRVEALNRALVLLADHELATSTLAARIAASTRACLPACVLAALGTLDGDLHGGAADHCHRLLLAAGPARRGARRAAGLSVPGYPVIYGDGDPRAAILLATLDELAGPAERAAIEATRAGLDDRALTVDFALGALCFVGRLPPGSARAVFATARCAGWIAHVREELAERPLRFRGRAVPRPAR